jgi:hypothetical protein
MEGEKMSMEGEEVSEASGQVAGGKNGGEVSVGGSVYGIRIGGSEVWDQGWRRLSSGNEIGKISLGKLDGLVNFQFPLSEREPETREEVWGSGRGGGRGERVGGRG